MKATMIRGSSLYSHISEILILSSSQYWDQPVIVAICFMEQNDDQVIGFGHKVAIFNARRSDGPLQFIRRLTDGFMTVSCKGVMREWTPNLVEVGRRELGFAVDLARLSVAGYFRTQSVNNIILSHSFGTSASVYDVSKAEVSFKFEWRARHVTAS
jgi:hypothetical protein